MTEMMCFLLVCIFCEIKTIFFIFNIRQMKVAQGATMGRVQSFMLILGRVGLGHFNVVGRDGSGQENWTHVQLRVHAIPIIVSL